MAGCRSCLLSRLAIVALMFGLAACGPAPAAAVASATPTVQVSPSPSPSPLCPQPITAIFAVRVTPPNGRQAGDAIHCLSVAGDTAINDRVLEWPDQFRRLLAATSHTAIELDSRNDLVLVDLGSAIVRSLGTLSSLGIGDNGPVGAVSSPDGSHLAIGGAHKLLLIDLESGAPHTLMTISGEQAPWLMPLRWTATGIIAHKVGFEGMGDLGLLMVDPATGTISMLNQGPNNQVAVSPNGKFFAVTAHVDLADGQSVRYPWQNAVDLVGQDGSRTRILTEANRWFTPLNVSDDGQVLFTSESQTDPVARDMGLYLARDGHPAQLLTSAFVGEWGGPAQFLDASRALVTHIRGGLGDKETGVDLELYRLCLDAANGCSVKRTTVITFSGTWPTVITSLAVLPVY
jgi:hypothetical protein